MTLARPSALVLLPLLVFGALHTYRRVRHRHGLVRDVLLLRHEPGVAWAALGTLAGASFLLGLALAGPGWGEPASAPVPTRVAVVLALDVSRSMTVRDVVPERMARARLAAQLIASETDAHIGLVAFASDAHVLLPPTADRGLLGQYLQALGPQVTSSPGSSIAGGVEEAIGALVGDSTWAKHVVVISDGEGFADTQDLEAAAVAARESGVHVHGLLVGTPSGGDVPGVVGAHSAADGRRLRGLAEATAGSVRDAEGGGPAELADLLDGSAAASADVADEGGGPVDLTGWIAALAVLALIAESFATQGRRGLAW